jgi:hypothetical protein
MKLRRSYYELPLITWKIHHSIRDYYVAAVCKVCYAQFSVLDLSMKREEKSSVISCISFQHYANANFLCYNVRLSFIVSLRNSIKTGNRILTSLVSVSKNIRS